MHKPRVVSNGMHHASSFLAIYSNRAVCMFQKKDMEYIKVNVPHVMKVYYFSDSAAGQCKNFKNLFNLLMHQEDFGIAAKPHFFVTLHGKSDYDGIRGTVK